MYSETPGIVGINTLIRNVKAKYFKTKTSVGYIVIGIAILIVTVLLSTCFVYKYKKKKAAASEYYLDEQESQAAVSPQPMPQPHVTLPMHHRQSVVMISTQPRNSISSRSSQAPPSAVKRLSIAPPPQQQYHRRSRQFIPEEEEEEEDVVDEDDDDDEEEMDHEEMRVNPVYGNKRSSYQHYPSFSAYSTGNRYQPQPPPHQQYYVPLAMQKEYRPSRITKSNRSNRSKSLY